MNRKQEEKRSLAFFHVLVNPVPTFSVKERRAQSSHKQTKGRWISRHVVDRPRSGPPACLYCGSGGLRDLRATLAPRFLLLLSMGSSRCDAARSPAPGGVGVGELISRAPQIMPGAIRLFLLKKFMHWVCSVMKSALPTCLRIGHADCGA